MLRLVKQGTKITDETTFIGASSAEIWEAFEAAEAAADTLVAA